ncbi:MAG: metallophosphoesterase [Phycisphaerales bacterium]|nr:MAG: metallophosphoesterase [Phycisphaerales bacterium]
MRTCFRTNTALSATVLLLLAILSVQAVFAEPCPIGRRDGDFNGDGFLNMPDLAGWAIRWLDSNCSNTDWCKCADLDVSGDVDMADLELFAHGWLAAVFDGTIVLGCPTESSVTINVLSNDRVEAYFEYGTESDAYTRQTATSTIEAGVPFEDVIANLQPNKRYYYRLRFRQPGGQEFNEGREYSFYTQRAPGSTFAFGVQGDSHLERGKRFDSDLYTRTLLTAASDLLDFYVLMGDDFSVDRLNPDTTSAGLVVQRYTLQRTHLGLIAHSVPLFLVNGNHEQAAGYLLDGTPNNVAVWAQNARNLYYPQPAPDGFYTGNTQPVEFIGLLRNYYAWMWGDALFVVIDPYWASPVPVDNVFGEGDKTKDKWLITHGDAQYQWLKQTLEQSTAKWKFVFAHHVNGTGRGGVEVASLYEWGGHNSQGALEFDTKRPGWDLPIHQLMVQNGVTILFQGHDHMFVRQELDGITYQTTPYPADPTYGLDKADRITSGDLVPCSGYIRATVSESSVLVEYVRTFLPKDETDSDSNGQVAYTYTVTMP